MPCACCNQTPLLCSSYELPFGAGTTNNNTVTVEWSGGSDSDPMSMVLNSNPNAYTMPDPVVTATNGNGDVYQLGLFRWMWYGDIVWDAYGGWFASCSPGNGITPPDEACLFSCDCVDLDTSLPCNDQTTNYELTLTGYVTTLFIPDDQSCIMELFGGQGSVAGASFNGQMSVWKYTYVVAGGESSGEADVEEVLFQTTYDGVNVNMTSFIPCDDYTPVAPTVTLSFAP